MSYQHQRLSQLARAHDGHGLTRPKTIVEELHDAGRVNLRTFSSPQQALTSLLQVILVTDATHRMR